MKILGISAYYHDSSAALVVNGEIIAAAQEERFSRRKNDARFPHQAIAYCLEQASIKLADLDYVVFYEKPLITFERLLETYLAYAPIGIRSFLVAMPVWLKEKLYLKSVLQKQLAQLGDCSRKQLPPLLFTEHHQAHAAAAFFPSPFQRAATVCLDAVGEWATTSVWLGEDNQLKLQWQINFPHSLGLLYSAFTYYIGFKVNSGEYKLMGLAAYGSPKYTDLIYKNLVDLKEDGTFRLNMEYFNYTTGLTMTNEKFHQLFGGKPRQPEELITQRHLDIAASIQKVVEEIILRLVKRVHEETGEKYLCLGGGVALNCVANGRIIRETPFQDIWIQPAAGDAGSAVGAALAVWHQYVNQPRVAQSQSDKMQGSYLGPQFAESEIRSYLDEIGAKYQYLADNQLIPQVAEILSQDNVVGWFQGRMEFGPRALGNRSILGNPQSPSMQSVMNLKIKYRESFRPFAPSVLVEKVADYFEIDRASPYMLLVAPVQDSLRISMTDEQQQLFGIEKLNVPRSSVPAITHVDYSARIQTVSQDTNPRYYHLIQHFAEKTGCSMLINTSFNIRGEPIVCTPKEAFKCFIRTEMDYLVLENFLLAKSDQPKALMDNLDKKEVEILAQQDARQLTEVSFLELSDHHSEINPQELRKFGLTLGAILAVIFGLLLPKLKGYSLPIYPWIITGILWLLSLLKPVWIQPVYQIVNRISLILGWFNTRLILGVLFYALFTPISAIMRLLNRDVMDRKFEKEKNSYRFPNTSIPPTTMTKPY
jgi:carbamoyltransferase